MKRITALLLAGLLLLTACREQQPEADAGHEESAERTEPAVDEHDEPEEERESVQEEEQEPEEKNAELNAVDIIGGYPLYIEFADTLPDYEYEPYFIYKNKLDSGDLIKISYPQSFKDLRIVNIIYDSSDENFYYNGLVFGFGSVYTGFYDVYYATGIPGGIPTEAFVFTTYDDEIYSYIISQSGETGGLIILKGDIEIPPDEYITDSEKTIPIKLWTYSEAEGYIYQEESFSYITIEVAAENFLEEAIRAMYLHKKMSINSIRYESDMIYIDINGSYESRMSQGSTALFALSNELKRTIASFPDVTQMEFSVDGRFNPGVKASGALDGVKTVEGIFTW